MEDVDDINISLKLRGARIIRRVKDLKGIGEYVSATFQSGFRLTRANLMVRAKASMHEQRQPVECMLAPPCWSTSLVQICLCSRQVRSAYRGLLRLAKAIPVQGDGCEKLAEVINPRECESSNMHIPRETSFFYNVHALCLQTHSAIRNRVLKDSRCLGGADELPQRCPRRGEGSGGSASAGREESIWK